jgi:hypothetical protein
VDGFDGIVTLLKEVHETSTPRTFSSDGNCFAPHIHRRRPKDSMRFCRNQMALDVEDTMGRGEDKDTRRLATNDGAFHVPGKQFAQMAYNV